MIRPKWVVGKLPHRAVGELARLAHEYLAQKKAVDAALAAYCRALRGARRIPTPGRGIAWHWCDRRVTRLFDTATAREHALDRCRDALFGAWPDGWAGFAVEGAEFWRRWDWFGNRWRLAVVPVAVEEVARV